MAVDAWMPRGHELPNGTRLKSLSYSGENWQIYSTDGASNILFARQVLAEKWVAGGLLDADLFVQVPFGSERYLCIVSDSGYHLEPVDLEARPETVTDAVSFALSLCQSRKLANEPSFHDAVYLEQYSRLLPSYSLTPALDDALVLGIWMSGGVPVPATSFRRLHQLTGWMNAGQLAKVITAAGLPVPQDAHLFGKGDSAQSTTAVTDALNSGTEQPEPQDSSAPAKVFRLPGRPFLEKFFNEHVIDIVLNPEKYQALGIGFPSSIILHGAPGCGKTFAVDRLVEFLDWPVYSINSNTVGSPYIHATSKKISEVFDQAIENAPSVLVIDEMESFLANRAFGASTNTHHIEETAEFLRRIPEAISKKVLIIAMTNMIEMIDPAIVRRGRFDHILKIEMPTREEVASVLESLLGALPTEDDLNLEHALDELTGKALSDASFVVREAARLSAKSGLTKICQQSIDEALASLPQKEETTKTRSIGFTVKP